MTNKELKKAVLWKKADQQKVQCALCSWRCMIAEGKLGRCFVRKNIDGELYSLNYDKVCAANPDPIEKKPLFHFQPGTRSYSIACIGCNFRCDFCQNWQISQPAIDEGRIEGSSMSPKQIVDLAVRSGCSSIAYTYTEPTVFFELCAETASLAKQKGLANVFVSNGFMTTEAIDFATDWLDAINIDLKSFSEDYYNRLCHAKLGPVLDTIKYIARQTNIWLEVTTLVVTDQNDSDQQLRNIAEFIADQAGTDVPWHISRFYPSYKYNDSGATPIRTLKKARQIGLDAGLRYVYLGNVPGEKAESTFCYNCGKLLVERFGYRILNNVIDNGNCSDCGVKIAGIFS